MGKIKFQKPKPDYKGDPIDPDGSEYLLSPYDQGVFAGLLEKGGFKIVSLPQLYADLVHYERRGREQAEHLRREAMGY